MIRVLVRNESRFDPVPGPADLHNTDAGHVRIVGETDPMDHAHWGYALGAFVLRGGYVERLTS